MSKSLHIEPLSRAAWRRVENEVFASLDRHERSGEFPVFRASEWPRPARRLGGVLAPAESGSREAAPGRRRRVLRAAVLTGLLLLLLAAWRSDTSGSGRSEERVSGAASAP